MKIAIPTDDGIRLSANTESPGGYLIITITGGEITNEELRWNKPGDRLAPDKSSPEKLSDCSSLIVGSVSKNVGKFFSSKPIDVITSKEVIITNIILEYLNTTLRKESNTCCCP